MIQIQSGDTGMHTIENPGQAIFLVILILVGIIGFSLLVGWIAKKSM